MLRRALIPRAIVFSSLVLGFAPLAGNNNLPGQNVVSSAPFQPAVVTDETKAQWQPTLAPGNESEIAPEIEPVSSAPPTRSSFMATWDEVTGATGYLLDVSTSESFNSYVDGYHDLDVGKVTGRVVTGLNPGTAYYYRVRPYSTIGLDNYLEAMTASTAPTTGLTIQATFDRSITGNPNAAAIEATINRVIAIYESLFRDPITIKILFRYARTAPDGTPMPPSRPGQGALSVYAIPWNTYVNALRADAKTSNDHLANASLGNYFFAANIYPASANGRALGLNTPTGMFANGTVGIGGPYDGIVTLNSGAPQQFTRPVNASHYDSQRLIEHELNEVIGFGSRLDTSLNYFRPQDLFSWSSAGVRNITSSGARYFSINGGVTNIVNFNQDPGGDQGDWSGASCPQPHPYVQNAFVCLGQSSDIAATSPEGINFDVIGYDLAPQTSPTSQTSLGNISTRSFVQTGEHVMIGGFVVDGPGPKRVIIRAIGPGLAPHGITNVLDNPRLELHGRTGALIASNDNWQTTILGGVITSNQVNAIQNSGHAPTAASESAIIANLQPGNYTAIVRGVNNTAGVALVDVYDLSPAASSNLGNVSTRSFVQTGQSVMIGGFVVQGTGTKRVIVRAIGPELRQHGINNALDDPRLELHNRSGALIASNNNWQTTELGGVVTSDQFSAIQNSGHAPTAASESAIIANLQPGNYTAIVRGVGNTTGVALVEVYDLN